MIHHCDSWSVSLSQRFTWYRVACFFSSLSLTTLPFFRLLADNLMIPYDIVYRIWAFNAIVRFATTQSKSGQRRWAVIYGLIAVVNVIFFSIQIIPNVIGFAI